MPPKQKHYKLLYETHQICITFKLPLWRTTYMVDIAPDSQMPDNVNVKMDCFVLAVAFIPRTGNQRDKMWRALTLKCTAG